MPEGGAQGLISGIIKGFGSTALEIEDRAYQTRQREKQNRIQILQAAVDNDNLDDESRQTALDQLGELIDGKPGGKKGAELKAILDPIVAVAQLLGGRPRPGQQKTSTPNEPMSELPPAPKPPTGGGGFGVPAAAAGTVTPAPKMKIKTAAQKQSEKIDSAKAVRAAEIRQQWELEDERHKEMLSRIPAEQDAELERLSTVAMKYGGYKTTADIPATMREAILEKVTGIKIDQAKSDKPQKLGASVKGPNLPVDAMDLTGTPITDRKGDTNYSAFRMADGSIVYQREDLKPLASDVDFQRQVDAAVASGVVPDKAKDFVLRQQFQKRRTDLLNAQLLSAGRTIGNQLQKDIVDGKLTRASANSILAAVRAEASSIARADANGTLNPSSPYAGKAAPEIENELLQFYGFARADIMKAISGTPAPAAGGGTSDRNPLGLPGMPQ